jgi:type II secretory pathway component PulF
MTLSGLLRARWWAFLLGAAAVLGGLVWWGRSRSARLWFDGAVISAPFVGRFARSMITARIARILGVLLEGRVPMLDAIRLTRQSAGNTRYAALLDRAEELVTRGEPMSLVMRDSPLINASVYEAVQTGERTGQIAPILLSIAEFMDEDNEVVLKSLTSLLEPVILIVLGAIVGFVAISMFMPLFDLTSAAQG